MPLRFFFGVSMTVEIHEVAPEDMRAMVTQLKHAELYGAANATRSGLFKMYDRVLDHDTAWVKRLWVAFDGFAPVGVASIEKPDYHNKEILDLFVAPAYRRQGIGDRLISAAKASGIVFDVYFTATSKSLYARHGFSKYLRNFSA